MQRKLVCFFVIMATIGLISSCKKKPKACFTPISTNITIGQTDSFSNCSEEATNYKWDFGDGGSSTNDNASHTFNQLGTFNVALTAGSPNGNNTISHAVVVGLPPYTSQNYIGSYTGTETCTLNGMGNTSITIAANGYFALHISNLYGSGATLNASIQDSVATIPPQIFNNGSGNSLLQGTLVLGNDTILGDLIITTVGVRDECAAVFVKH